MSVTVERSFLPSSRYHFDTGRCSYANGYAQIDTRQDASYFGQWCSPFERTIVSYAEGDVAITKADTDEEFVQAVRAVAEWTNSHGYGPMRIDALANDRLAAAFQALGLTDLLH
jgi:hypothetical protein